MKCQFAFLVFFLTNFQLNFLGHCVQVETKNGVIGGIEDKVNGQKIFKFLAIPYASPPTGTLRFRRPQPYGQWTGVLNATAHGPSCPQYIFENDKEYLPNLRISEDCLVLNIYVPRTMRQPLKSVMIWIHGGGYRAGQGMMFDGSELALHGDVIIVTINYRLNVFGFLRTCDGTYPGNYGLWDQHFAIKWVKSNIESFSGNNQSITIFGESAGGSSVGLHTISPRSANLFQRAISQSGVALSSFSTAHADAVCQTTLRMGQNLNCSTNTGATANNTAIIECLQQKDVNDLLHALSLASTVTEEMDFTSYMGPVVDGDFLIESPSDFFSGRQQSRATLSVFNALDYMIGFNSNEGLLYYTLLAHKDRLKIDPDVSIPKRVLCDSVIPALVRAFYSDNRKVSEAICEFVSGAKIYHSRLALDIYSDISIVAPSVNTANIHVKSKQKSTYLYMFSMQPKYGLIKVRPPWFRGADHADELFYLFGLDGIYPNNETIDTDNGEVSSKMMSYWANFGKHGNPNGEGNQPWKEYGDDKNYLEINAPVTYGQALFRERMEFWLECVPKILKNGHCTELTGTTESATGGKREINWTLVYVVMLITKICGF